MYGKLVVVVFYVCFFYKIDYSDYLKSLISRIYEVYVFSIKYRYSDILLKIHKLHLSRLCCCNHTCYCVNMVSVTSASRYHPRYQNRSSMYIRGLIPRNFAELAEAVPIGSIWFEVFSFTLIYFHLVKLTNAVGTQLHRVGIFSDMHSNRNVRDFRRSWRSKDRHPKFNHLSHEYPKSYSVRIGQLCSSIVQAVP